MKKSLFGFVVVGLAVGALVWSTHAKPERPRAVSREASEPIGGFGGQDAWSFDGTAIESTGFESTDGWNLGFMCDPTYFTNCLGAPLPAGCIAGDPAANGNCCSDDPNPNTGWFMSISSEHCKEPHIDTINPATGEQHMRFTRDPAGGNPPGCVGDASVSACRQTVFTPAVAALPIAPTTISFNIAQEAVSGVPPWGSTFLYWGIADGGAGDYLNVYFSYYGVAYFYDLGFAAYYGMGYTSGSGGYDSVQVLLDPCNDTLQYTYNGLVLANSTGMVGMDGWISRAIIVHDNNTFAWDFDDYVITHGDPCPTTCGADGVEPGEECDHGPDEDANCPGQCIAAGLDNECTCAREGADCDTATEAFNGTNGPFLTHGGFFKYTADTPFTTIDTCGGPMGDTEIWWDFAVDCPLEPLPEVTNDDCDIAALGCGTYQSCLCVPTNVGQTYVFVVGAWDDIVPPPLGSLISVNISKKLSCDPYEEIPGGACCNGIDGTCTDGGPVEECTCLDENQVEQCAWTENKTCDLITCERHTGACCDGTTGVCVNGLFPEDCLAEWQVYHKGMDCIDVVCEEITGACCNTLNGTCVDVIAGDCMLGEWTTWTKGVACSEITCAADLGACCDHDDGTCTSTTNAGCNCEKCEWTKGMDCSMVECMANFTPIPTVSEWGLAILALLLLVGAKVYFGRRQATA